MFYVYRRKKKDIINVDEFSCEKVLTGEVRNDSIYHVVGKDKK
ncbi:MAG: hypothetical protein N4A57_07405 [Anaeromicrobium sp.]|jgi:hypothetical protein|nr:hypothetical protein [Anaeromicrobium sp.]MCT4594076.1 hypothetical protein [Anaeromicrobium sp.]